MLPCSAGTVRICPRTSKATRCPVGEMEGLESCPAETSTQRGRAWIWSPRTCTTRGVTRSVPAAAPTTVPGAAPAASGSSRCSRPACSYTSTPPPASRCFTSKSVWKVRCRASPVAGSQDQTFIIQSASLR
jgi:hypothetical protein